VSAEEIRAGLAERRQGRAAIRLIGASAAFTIAITDAQSEGLTIDRATALARNALKAVGLEGPADDDDMTGWLEAIAAYDDTVYGGCESCERPKLEADVCTGATDEDGDIWVCQACIDAGRVKLEPTERRT
jgi:hypothetical protein